MLIPVAVINVRFMESTGEISLGMRVTVLVDGGLRSYTFVDQRVADPSRGYVEVNSTFAKGLLGKRLGDVVTLELSEGEFVKAIVVQIQKFYDL